MLVVGSLAVFTPFVGLPSETFVARHVNELAPGRTLTVATRMGMPASPTWAASGPVVDLDGTPPPSGVRWLATRIAARLRGTSAGRYRWAPSTADLRVLDAAFTEHDVSVVMTEFLDVWLPLVPWLRARGVRVVAHAHGNDISVRLRSPFWRNGYAAYDDVDAVVTVSEVSRRRLIDLGITGERIHVIPCGVDVPQDAPDQRPERDTVEVVAVGRMVPKKHPLATIEAFALASVHEPRLRLTMIGDGPLLDDARAAVAQSGLDDRVQLLGQRPHADALQKMRESDIFVQHSVVSPVDGDEEGLPVGVLEAMAFALPVVSTRHAGIPEAVEEGVTGVLANEGDVHATAAALIDLTRDRDKRRAFGLAGHARALDRFSAVRECRDLRALLGVDVGAGA
ncbi:MAG: colanic acid/amylovoran biosynthesis glycosyltransferase [Actinomycetota bacterium]